GDACDKCRSCLKVTAGTHPDLTELNPGARWIKVDDVREVLADIGLKPYESRIKCIIIEPAEYLNAESANALLKTLEEPPPNTMIVLVSHRPKLLLPTIVSRCQLIRFNEDGDTGLAEAGETPTDSVKGRQGLGGESHLHQEILSLLSGGDPALLARKYFDSEGWEVLPETVSIVESIVRDVMALRLGCEQVMNGPLREIPIRRVDIGEIENILSLIRAMRRGVNENINLRIAATELFIMLSQLAGS
ncbi:MAG TPA: hypothetical protein VMU10_12835, partial [Desulfomonilia bacterium]|nr:hypothetical protein [Desulfomonilia bacterium]